MAVQSAASPPCGLAGGLTLANVAAAIAQVHPWLVDVSGDTFSFVGWSLLPLTLNWVVQFNQPIGVMQLKSGHRRGAHRCPTGR